MTRDKFLQVLDWELAGMRCDAEHAWDEGRVEFPFGSQLVITEDTGMPMRDWLQAKDIDPEALANKAKEKVDRETNPND